MKTATVRRLDHEWTGKTVVVGKQSGFHPEGFFVCELLSEQLLPEGKRLICVFPETDLVYVRCAGSIRCSTMVRNEGDVEMLRALESK